VSAICCTSRSRDLAGDGWNKAFASLRQKFPNVYEAKLKEGILVDAQIKQLFEDHIYITKLNATERRGLEAFGNVCKDFLDNELVENCS
jgi:hypothetical protein